MKWSLVEICKYANSTSWKNSQVKEQAKLVNEAQCSAKVELNNVTKRQNKRCNSQASSVPKGQGRVVKWDALQSQQTWPFDFQPF